jgi:hypothetical protein
MSKTELDFNKLEQDLKLRQIEGKAQHIEINERSLEAYREEFSKKGLVITKKEEYPREDFYLVKKQKQFDSLVDPTKGIKKVIHTMVRQPITIFDKQGKPVVKDALYYNGMYFGVDKRDNEIHCSFHEGSFKRPKLVFTLVDSAHPYDSTAGERRGEYRISGFNYEHYIFLPTDKKERRKFLEDIVSKCTGTYTGNLKGFLSYRNPTPANDHSGSHGGMVTWDQFCDLSIEELGELQNKAYYRERETGAIKDVTGQRVAYDYGSKKVETTKDR